MEKYILVPKVAVFLSTCTCSGSVQSFRSFNVSPFLNASVLAFWLYSTARLSIFFKLFNFEFWERNFVYVFVLLTGKCMDILQYCLIVFSFFLIRYIFYLSRWSLYLTCFFVCLFVCEQWIQFNTRSLWFWVKEWQPSYTVAVYVSAVSVNTSSLFKFEQVFYLYLWNHLCINILSSVIPINFWFFNIFFVCVVILRFYQ